MFRGKTTKIKIGSVGEESAAGSPVCWKLWPAESPVPSGASRLIGVGLVVGFALVVGLVVGATQDLESFYAL